MKVLSTDSNHLVCFENVANDENILNFENAGFVD